MTIASFLSRDQLCISAAPGPAGFPILGVSGRFRTDPLQFVVDTARDFGSIARLNLGSDTLYMVNDPRLVQHVLHDNAQNYQKSRFYRKLAPFFGEGLITSNGEDWRRQRTVSQPSFAGPNLKNMVEDMICVAEGLACRWSTLEGPIDIGPDMMHSTLRIALRTLFSSTIPDADVMRLHDALTEILREAERRLWSMNITPELLPTRRRLQFNRAIRVIDEIVYRLIRERRREGRTCTDLLSALLRAEDQNGQPYSDKVLRDQISSLLIAGHESGASALTWAWYYMSKYPAIAQKVRAELSTVLGGHAPTFDDLTELRYTKAVLQESMRLSPPIWTMSREAIEDDELGGYHVPRGTAVMVCPYSMHRDGRYWTNPEGFDPHRFLLDQVNTRPRYAFFPFGGGQRMCIGNRFAMLEGLVMIAIIAQRFRLDLLPGHIVEPEPMISLRAKHGMAMKVVEISRPAIKVS